MPEALTNRPAALVSSIGRNRQTERRIRIGLEMFLAAAVEPSATWTKETGPLETHATYKAFTRSAKRKPPASKSAARTLVANLVSVS